MGNGKQNKNLTLSTKTKTGFSVFRSADVRWHEKGCRDMTAGTFASNLTLPSFQLKWGAFEKEPSATG
ncbi:MAG: hypothetical protein Q7S52_01860 [bacterium]|nr:hypothetical protein [bacterium]